ncbi:MAG: MATE family efflux transporter [Lachnospiraceae bacterium]|nr:MATE family efflux transporter [Lachnospiraceae bacterium]
MTSRKSASRGIDLTQGSPIKVIILFALPMLLGNIFQMLYTVVDSYFMGNYVSTEAMAAVGACSSMINFFLNVSIGIATGLGIVIAQYVGAKNDDAVHRVSMNALFMILITALIMTTLALSLNRTILRWLGTPEDIIRMSIRYSTTVLAGLVCTLTYNMTAALLRGLGNSRAPLYFLILASVMHIILDYVFVLGLKMGVVGVASATIASQGLSAVLTLIYMYRKYPIMRFSLKEFRPDSEIVKKVCKLGIPMGLQSGCFTIGMMTIQKVINSFGTMVVSGYTVGARCEEISWCTFTTLSQAIATYTGQNAGAGDIPRIRKGVRSSLILLLFLTCTATLLVWLFGRPLASLFVPEEPQVQEIAYGFLKVNSAFFIPMGFVMLYNFALKGMGEITVPMISAFIELFCKVFFSIVLAKAFGYFGIWFAEPLGWTLGCILPMIRYYSGKWVKGVEAL